MPRTGLSSDEMRQAALDATEAAIRRFGAERARVTDIAKSIGVNHAILYRHFPDKAALLDGVSERWLKKMEGVLAQVAKERGSPEERLRAWFLVLHRLKREKVLSDPELYGAFSMAAERARPFIVEHLAIMMGQLTALVSEGMEAGPFARGDAQEKAAVLFEATLAFHHPRLVLDMIEEDREENLVALLNLLIAGLRAP